MKLLDHFHQLTKHPKNAQELKGLILQLAVQGKLTVQWRAENPNTESANDLLKRIESAKFKLIRDKIFKAKYDTDKFEPLIKRPSIPKNWRYVTIGNICELITGATPSKAKSEYFGGNIKWLVSGDIHKGYIYDCEGRITELGMNSSNCKVLPVDSIMIALNGQGKTRATVALLKTAATCNQSLVAMKPFLDNTHLSKYIYYFLKGKYYQIRDITGQKQRRGLNMTLVSQLPLALPPLPEQKAIVEMVDVLFKEVEQLEQLTTQRVQLKQDFAQSALQQLSNGDTNEAWVFLKKHIPTFFNEEANIKKLRETVLQLAVQGKLTAQWRAENPNVEPATELLKRIQAEKTQLIKEKKIKKEKLLPPITEGKIPYELPEGWAWCRLGEVILNIEAGKSPRCHSHPAPDKSYGVLKLSAISWGTFNPYENKALPLEIEPFTNFSVKKGDFLMTRANTALLVGNSVIVERNYPYLLINDKILRVIFSDFIDKEFFNLLNKTSVTRNHLIQVATGTSDSMKNISRYNIKLTPTPFPPLPEQKAIVSKVNKLMALCDVLEQEVKQNKAQSEQLMQSCLKEVFEH